MPRVPHRPLDTECTLPTRSGKQGIMPSRRQPLTTRQLEVLQWIAGGCPDRPWPDERHKLTAHALANRHLVQVRRRGKTWHATLTEDGKYYLQHGVYPTQPPPQPPATTSRDDPETAMTVARDAVRHAIAERTPRHTSRRRPSPAVSPLKDIPMRYKIIVSRVQTAERHVRAVTEDDAIRKVQDELARPYGFIGGWTTIATDMDIVTAESPLNDSAATQINIPDGGYLLSIKGAAKYLGLSYSTVYDLLNSGEIAHVMVGTRRYISRDQLQAFIDANTHIGYHLR